MVKLFKLQLPLKGEVAIMAITRQVVEYVANLARLNLTEAEAEKLTGEMQDIIGYVDKLNELDTKGLTPKEHVIPIRNVFREDIAEDSYNRDDILANAPSSESGCFKVPKIVE